MKKAKRHQYRGNGFVISTIPEDPWMVVIQQGSTKATVAALGGVHPQKEWDGLSNPRLVSVKKTASAATWTFEAKSTTWKKFRTVWVLTKDSCRVRNEVTGKGVVDVVSWFETVPAARLPEPDNTLSWVRGLRQPIRDNSVYSGYFHTQVFCPQPYAGRTTHRHADEESYLTCACTFGPVNFNTWFSPGLMCFGLLPKRGKGWYVGIGAPLGEHQYHTFRYSGGRGGWGLSADFDGMKKINGQWTSPEIELSWADTVETGLKNHVASGLKHGWFPKPARALPKEWRRPMYCGWGQQQVWSRSAEDKVKLPYLNLLVSPAAEAMASEASYRKMVEIIDEAKLPVGTITIDAAWSTSMCIPVCDPKKWRDLKGFIAEEHAKGRKVLMWMACWNPVFLPNWVKMKKSNPELKDVVDPTNPRFRRAVEKAIYEVISPEGLNADGFKLDFTGDMPRGNGYLPHKQIWGLELLRNYVGLIYKSIKRAKKDAILETHCANPLFADITNILRLNDIFSDREDIRPIMKHRADMARIANDQWVIDTDNDPFISTEAWWDFMQYQPEIGMPSLYTLTHMCRSWQEVPPGRLKKLAGIWRSYLKKEGLE